MIMELPNVSISPVPLFRDPATLSSEKLNDPDHALKELVRLDGGKHKIIGCSRCHHCR